jgi:hypothetical protein
MKKYYSVFLAIGILSTAHGSFAASVTQGGGYGPLIDHPNVPDYEPSVVRYHERDLRVWTCTAYNNQDTIFLTIFGTDKPTGPQDIAYGPVPVLRPSPGYWDEAHACSPAVVREPGSHWLRMYYECSKPAALHHADICLARSDDYGVTWHKVGMIIANPLRDSPGDSRYGIGHTSAVINRQNTNTTILYYWCQAPGCHEMRGRLLGSDGSTYLGEFPTNLPFASKVKYYDPAWTGGKGEFFVATSLAVSINPNDPPVNGKFGVFVAENGYTFRLADPPLVVPGPRCGQDPGQLVADYDGWIRWPVSNLQALIGADYTLACEKYGPSRGVYLTRFGINLP